MDAQPRSTADVTRAVKRATRGHGVVGTWTTDGANFTYACGFRGTTRGTARAVSLVRARMC